MIARIRIHRREEPVITNGRMTTWLDAQHQNAATANRALERPALHAVAAIGLRIRQERQKGAVLSTSWLNCPVTSLDLWTASW